MFYYVTSQSFSKDQKDQIINGLKRRGGIKPCFLKSSYQIISVSVALHTPGTWVHQDDLQEFQHTVVSQICRAAEYPALH